MFQLLQRSLAASTRLDPRHSHEHLSQTGLRYLAKMQNRVFRSFCSNLDTTHTVWIVGFKAISFHVVVGFDCFQSCSEKAAVASQEAVAYAAPM